MGLSEPVLAAIDEATTLVKRIVKAALVGDEF